MHVGTHTAASLSITVMVAVVIHAAGVPTSPRSPSIGEQDKQGAGAQYFYSLEPERGAYHFGYDTGSHQHQSFREEVRTEDGGVHGSYGYVDSGVLRVTEYTADRLGYRCRQTIRYLVEPGKGVFVQARNAHSKTASHEPQPTSTFSRDWASKASHREPLEDRYGNGQNWEANSHSQLNSQKQSRQSWETSRQRATQPAKPARVLGKKVAGHYKDITMEPAVGGTGAVATWDSAHKSEIRDEEVFGLDQQGLHYLQQQNNLRQTAGGTLVWPVTEDGARVVWQPF